MPDRRCPLSMPFRVYVTLSRVSASASGLMVLLVPVDFPLNILKLKYI